MRSQNQSNLISILITLLLLAIIVLVVDTSCWSVFLGLKAEAILISLIIAAAIQIISGVLYYYARKQYGVSLKIRDMLLLPAVMGLWGFILPIQGSLIFSTLFFKKKFNMTVSESLSINIYLYLLTLAFTGLICLIIAFSEQLFFTWFGILSLLLLCNPLLLAIVNKISNYNVPGRFIFLEKVKMFIFSLVRNTSSLWSNPGFLLKMTVLKTAHLFLSIVWFYYISVILGFDLSFLEVALMSLVANASLIIKITPGNLGTTQLVTGAFMGFTGHSPDKAIMITLYATATVMILNYTIGLYGNYYYFKRVNIFNMKKENHSECK